MIDDNCGVFGNYNVGARLVYKFCYDFSSLPAEITATSFKLFDGSSDVYNTFYNPLNGLFIFGTSKASNGNNLFIKNCVKELDDIDKPTEVVSPSGDCAIVYSQCDLRGCA
jgi:hypothetical protein